MCVITVIAPPMYTFVCKYIHPATHRYERQHKHRVKITYKHASTQIKIQTDTGPHMHMHVKLVDTTSKQQGLQLFSAEIST